LFGFNRQDHNERPEVDMKASRLRRRLTRYNEVGASAVEYALMITMIAAVIVVAVALTGPALISIFNEAAAAI
jgi:Flp pilus assembly pilin Flp